uniref:tRNA(Phe) 7-((3-amino-3-carboxypropyl)-4-demethylwyosine(37)-N(4))-methyltransferase n=1 Tax=Geoglobus ahangari TaxID=113653 RepID=A0A7C3YCY4_9EURY
MRILSGIQISLNPNWKKFRETVLSRYRQADIDVEIKPVLDIINASESFVTLSSCAGRIVVMDMPNFGDKKNSVFLGKWHQPPEFSEVMEAILKGQRQTWFMMHPPIIHVACRSLFDAFDLLEIAKRSGFRRSGLISQKKFAIEIASQERVEMLVAENGELLMNEKALKRNFELSVEKLKKSRERIFKFSRTFEEYFL